MTAAQIHQAAPVNARVAGWRAAGRRAARLPAAAGTGGLPASTENVFVPSSRVPIPRRKTTNPTNPTSVASSFQIQICRADERGVPPFRVWPNQSRAYPMAALEMWSPGCVVTGVYRTRAVPSAIEPYTLPGSMSDVTSKTFFSFSLLTTSAARGTPHMSTENSSNLL